MYRLVIQRAPFLERFAYLQVLKFTAGVGLSHGLIFQQYPATEFIHDLDPPTSTTNNKYNQTSNETNPSKRLSAQKKRCGKIPFSFSPRFDLSTGPLPQPPLRGGPRVDSETDVGEQRDRPSLEDLSFGCHQGRCDLGFGSGRAGVWELRVLVFFCDFVVSCSGVAFGS